MAVPVPIPYSPMTPILSTAGLPARQQFDYWREAACRHFYQFQPCRFDHASGYEASLSGSRFGAFSLVAFQAPAHDWLRGRQEVARTDDETYSLVASCPAAAALVRAEGDAEVALRPGDLGLTSSSIPQTVRQQGRAAFHLVKFPRALLDPMLPTRARGRLPRKLIRGESGLGAVICRYFESLLREAPRMEPTTTEAALRHLIGLVGLHQADSPQPTPEGQQALRAARLAEAQRFVERHLADPALDSARAAAALHISVRQLSLLFEPTGESFARHVTRRRLENACALLRGPCGRGRKVADIAFSCGFDSVATFYRAFTRAYGVSPGAMRPG
ncbi:helix-turn-helix domain-containing protein [Roseomonas sp. F4]